MGYKILGYAVWNGGKWYMKQRYGGSPPTRRYVAIGLVAFGVGALLVNRTHRGSST